MVKRSEWKLKQLFLLLGVGLWLVTILLSLLDPHRGNTFNLSNIDVFLLELTIYLPLLVIWILAINGASSFKRYAVSIKDSPDGQALNSVSNGLLIVVVYFILQSFTGTLPAYFVGSSWLTPMVFIHNYLPTAVALIGFTTICVGSFKLTRVIHKSLSAERLTAALLPYVLLGIIFAVFFYQNISHTITGGIPNFAAAGRGPFYSLGLPYLLTWLVGIAALINIAEYARFVKGVIYKKALKNLIRGITGVLTFSILVQLLSLSNTFLGKLKLGNLLLLLYILLALYAVGFIFIARGAQKLRRIEVIT